MSNSLKLTIFKPPSYIYKLSRYTQKNHNKSLTYQLYYNNQTILRKYPNLINLSDKENLSKYQWRKNTTSTIVKVLYVQLLNNSTQQLNPNSIQNNPLQSSLNNKSTQINVNVYTEHLQTNLNQMDNLTLGQAIYVLKECIIGFKDLWERENAVTINKSCIGLNREGRLKVWINEDLSANLIDQNLQQSQKSSKQQQILTSQPLIVSKIIKTIFLKSSTSCRFFFYGLQKELSMKKFGFNNCLQYINVFVVNTNNLQIPENLEYLLSLNKNNKIKNKHINNLQASNIRTTKSRYVNTNNPIESRQRKLSQTQYSLSNLTNSRQFNSLIRINMRENTEKSLKNYQNQHKQKINLQVKNGQQSVRHNQTIQRQEKLKESNKTASLTFLLRKQNSSKKLNLLTEGNEQQQKNHHQNKNKQNIKEQKISLHVINEKNQKISTDIIATDKKSNNMISSKSKQNISFHKHRPSITVMPSFLTRLNGQKPEQNIKQHKSKDNMTSSAKYNQINRCKRQSKNSNSFKSQQSRSNSIISSRTQNLIKCKSSKFGKFQSRGLGKPGNNSNTQNNLENNNNLIKPFQNFMLKDNNKLNDFEQKIRVRSASANIKELPALQTPSTMLYSQHQYQKNPCELNNYQRNSNSKNKLTTLQNLATITVQKSNQSHKSPSANKSIRSVQKSVDKLSSNNSQDGGYKKRSFLTKTNYQSQTDELNDKNNQISHSSRMNFSYMSIDNRIMISSKRLDSLENIGAAGNLAYTNNFVNNNNLINSNNPNSLNNNLTNNNIKRSLISNKYQCGQIIQNPSCKQIQQQNQSKSYDGSSLRNTQNLNDIIQRNNYVINGDGVTEDNQNQLQLINLQGKLACSGEFMVMKQRNIQNQEKQKQKWNFISSRRDNKSQDDSIEELKQKNQQLLIKNQWKKTINNLQIGEGSILNQSIVDLNDSIIQTQPLPDIKLQKLDKLTKNMYFSIVKKSQDSILTYPNTKTYNNFNGVPNLNNEQKDCLMRNE